MAKKAEKKAEEKKWYQKPANIAWMVIGVIVLLIILWIPIAYNNLVKLQQGVNAQWANVETVYQRRADLIPNLVETVKGYAAHEKTVLEDITNARSAWSAAKTVDEKVAAANNLDSAIARLLVVVENYPDLKANQNFLALQDELAGTENRISVERMRFNEKVMAYNTAIKRFPTVIIANMFGFVEKQYYKAAEGAEIAPKVKF
jgi:LemA protein